MQSSTDASRVYKMRRRAQTLGCARCKPHLGENRNVRSRRRFVGGKWVLRKHKDQK